MTKIKDVVQFWFFNQFQPPEILYTSKMKIIILTKIIEFTKKIFIETSNRFPFYVIRECFGETMKINSLDFGSEKSKFLFQIFSNFSTLKMSEYY